MFLYLSLAPFLNHDKKAPHCSFSSSSFQHQEKQPLNPWEESRWWSQHNTQQLKWLSRWQFGIQWPASLATLHGRNGQAVINRYHHVNTAKMSWGKSVTPYVSRTLPFWPMGGLYCLGGRGYMRTCTAGIQVGIWLRIWLIESACYSIYLPEEGFK